MDDGETIACAKLFRAVIIRALWDACEEPLPRRILSKNRKAEAQRENARQHVFIRRTAARAWLKSNGEDLVGICRLADWEPGYITRVVAQLEASGWKMPDVNIGDVNG